MLWGDVELTLPPYKSPTARERSSFSIAWASSTSPLLSEWETDGSEGELRDRDDGPGGERRLQHCATLDADDAVNDYRSSLAPSTAVLSSAASSPHSEGTTRSTITESMWPTVIAAAAHSTEVVQREGVKASRNHPSKLTNVRLVETKNGVSVYHYAKRRRRTSATHDHEQDEPSLRVLGFAQLHAPLNEIVKLIGPKSPLSFAMLNPGVKDYKTLGVLIDEPTHYVAVKSMVMDPQWQAPHTTRTRTFTVIESHTSFQTDSGRRGWAVSYHSLYWQDCPQPPLGAVRGSVYNTGIVALESLQKKGTVDIFTVAELKLKGQASTRVNFSASRDRVFDTILLLKGTLEQRATRELQQRTPLADKCSQCSQPGDVSPLSRCRNCCVPVCGDCCSSWTRGTKEIRLCFRCWGETTLHF